MIRLLLYSQDSSLQYLLAPTLGDEFFVFHERRMERIKEVVSQGQCDVVILDLDSSTFPVQQQLGFLDELRDSGTPVVVMTDDNGRATALDLVQRGFSNYVRKPPSLPELKIVVRRAHEFAVLKRELQTVKQQLQPSGCDRMIGSTVPAARLFTIWCGAWQPGCFRPDHGRKAGLVEELIARLNPSHNLGNRKNLPFVAVSRAGRFLRH